MSVVGSILHASVGGSIELLTLSAAGALLAHLGHLSAKVATNLSSALYKLFIPALIFGSVLDTVHTALKHSQFAQPHSGALQQVWVPLVLALGVFFVAGLIAFPVTYLVAGRKEEAVRRAIFLCLVLGNANTMPLMVMQSLCTTFAPLEQQGIDRCYTRAMGYASLYMTVVNVVTWTVLFQYMMFAPDSSAPAADESMGLMESQHTGYSGAAAGGSGGVQRPQDNSIRMAIEKAFLSPPFLTVVLASILAVLPGVPELFLSDAGMLQPLLLSINTLGQVVVPVSCMIVGSQMYRSYLAGPSEVQAREEEAPDKERFGGRAIAAIIAVRLVLLPFVGRVIHTVLGLTKSIESAELGVFVLSQWNVPTANNTVIMINLVTESMPRIGERLRKDAALCLFWQFVITPIFLTVNTALALVIQFPTS